jgi:hypothetical protein
MKRWRSLPLVENLRRDDLSPLDAALGLSRFQEVHQLSTEGLSRPSVANIHPRAGSTAPPCPPDPVSPLRGCLVSVMQASEPRPRHSGAAWNPGYRRATAGGSSLRKRVVRSIVVIVGDVLLQQSPEVALVEHDDLVEQLSAHTAYPTFRNAVLPRAPVRRSRWSQTERFHHGDHTLTEACVAIKHQVAQVSHSRCER